ncbi:cationic peroxidase 1-like [Malania oleifera]|uniref:cationic peroxidase 1-like n=1 Tax=Malania oleifera TaxID=397392 RepID=UPI0025ADF6F6|nr:cationic peroxidase 1-like [Malania oleifera]
MGASLLRLHFHDCFVNGCDGSVLLDDTEDVPGEKNAPANKNSLRAFEVVDQIREAVNSFCGDDVVSCADILAIAARDSIVALGGTTYDVLVGRKDRRYVSLTNASSIQNLPAPFFNYSALVANFESHGLTEKDMITLSGSHTVGSAQCFVFRNRVYNDTNINKSFASYLQKICPKRGQDSNLQPLDSGFPLNRFDNNYYKNLLQNKGLLHSDQELYNDGTGGFSFNNIMVWYYSLDQNVFMNEFGKSMINMGNICVSIPHHDKYEVRRDCRRLN